MKNNTANRETELEQELAKITPESLHRDADYGKPLFNRRIDYNMFQDTYINVTDIDNVEQAGITKLGKDLRVAATTMTQAEARYLVDYYYQLQDDRIRAKGRQRAFSADGEPHELIVWLSDNTAFLEKQIAKGLLAYAQSHPVGQWSLSITGIGGVISAGLLAHIDIGKAPTAGHIESFGGINPTMTWSKGQIRPFNAKLKVLLWKIGESFVKTSNRESDFYGKIYQQAKEHLTMLNETGAFAGDAARILTEKKWGKDTEAYKMYMSGKLPLAQIHARAKRKAVKLFISHWHYVAYRYAFGKEPSLPYSIAIQEHAHYIAPPNNPFE